MSAVSIEGSFDDCIGGMGFDDAFNELVFSESGIAEVPNPVFPDQDIATTVTNNQQREKQHCHAGDGAFVSEANRHICHSCGAKGCDLKVLGCGCTFHAVSFSSSDFGS